MSEAGMFIIIAMLNKGAASKEKTLRKAIEASAKVIEKQLRLSYDDVDKIKGFRKGMIT